MQLALLIPTTEVLENGEKKVVEKEKVFFAPFVRGRLLREAITLTKKSDFNNLDEAALDELINYVVKVYGKQFTLDEFYDGIASEIMIQTIADTIQSVVGVSNVNQAQAAIAAQASNQDAAPAIETVKN
ncbi:phage tail assembly chaperone G [Priestia aryabhattai]|uniref:phage tail assembly chaperone G n=1 Tax=Priestia aryabhattai TaxID=412384 RepID=UPI003CBF70AE